MIEGLTTEQVQQKIAEGKVNKTSHHTKTLREIFVTNLFSKFNLFFFIIIGGLFLVYFQTGSVTILLDGWGIFSLVFINTTVAIVQEIRAKSMLDKVQLLIDKRISVVRNAELIKIQPEELVEEDVVFVERGDQIVADGSIIENNHAEVDESLLTGESEPVIKKTGDMMMSGSFVVSGSCYFVAEKLGHDSFAGKIMTAAKSFKYIVSPLQNTLLQTIRILAAIAVILIILRAINNTSTIGIFAIDAIRQYTTIIIALIPHGLIFLTTISYVVGIYRISKLGAVVQKINAIEAFSGINVICADKTGTLTQNIMSVTQLTKIGDMTDADMQKMLGTYAKYSSYKNSTLNALNIYAAEENIQVIDELSFNSEKKYSAIKIKKNNTEKIYLFGAYDVLRKFITPEQLSRIDEQQIKLFRNLLFVEIHSHHADITESIEQDSKNVIGIVSLLDTVRPDSQEVLEHFQKKNIDIKILSGDAPFAIQAIANKVGWSVKDDELITGIELDKLDTESFKTAITQKKIFARLSPENKKDIINTLKDMGLYTAMIGDGVNDLPAIKNSSLGIAMEEGSQVTKEIADIILIQNKFTLLPKIFDEGNRIVNTVRMAAKLFLTKNISVTMLTLLSVFTALPFLLTPRKVSFLNIFIITLPSFLISIYNKDTIAKKYFIRDIFATVAISAVFVVVFGYLGYYLAPNIWPEIVESCRVGIFIGIVVFICMGNFLSAVLPYHNTQSKIIFALYAFLIVITLFLMSIIDLSQTFLFWFKELYEIPTLSREHWLFIVIVGSFGAGLLFVIQHIKRLVLKKYIGD